MSTAAYRAAHKEECTAYDAAYRAAHKEECAAYDAAHWIQRRTAQWFRRIRQRITTKTQRLTELQAEKARLEGVIANGT